MEQTKNGYLVEQSSFTAFAFRGPPLERKKNRDDVLDMMSCVLMEYVVPGTIQALKYPTLLLNFKGFQSR